MAPNVIVKEWYRSIRVAVIFWRNNSTQKNSLNKPRNTTRQNTVDRYHRNQKKNTFSEKTITKKVAQTLSDKNKAIRVAWKSFWISNKKKKKHFLKPKNAHDGDLCVHRVESSEPQWLPVGKCSKFTQDWESLINGTNWWGLRESTSQFDGPVKLRDDNGAVRFVLSHCHLPILDGLWEKNKWPIFLFLLLRQKKRGKLTQ